MYSIVESFCFLCSLLFCLVYAHLCTPRYTPLYTFACDCTLMWLLTINELSILHQASLLSCLSTAVGRVHEPPLLNGVVNLQQHNYGTQCGAHGRWTGPNASRHNTRLLDGSASHPPLKGHQHHHQLAPVGWLVADTRSHTKIDFSPEKNCSKHTTFAEQPILGSLPYHHTPQEGRRTLPNQEQGTLCLCSHPLHSQGKEKTKRNPTTRWEVPRSSLRQAGNLGREVTPEPTQQDAVNCAVKKRW